MCFFWSIVDLQCCVTFCITANWVESKKMVQMNFFAKQKWSYRCYVCLNPLPSRGEHGAVCRRGRRGNRGCRPCGALSSRSAQAAGGPAREGHPRVSGGESCSDRRAHTLGGLPGPTSFPRAVPRLEGEGSMKSSFYTQSRLYCISVSKWKECGKPFHPVLSLRGYL